jgi:DNA-binding SARP family transcriptional activator
MFELDILGPLVLRAQGRPVWLRPMERAVLLALYCAEGAALSPQRLGALLWDQPGDRSPVTLRRHIAGTRKAAAGDVVVTRRPGSGAMSYSLGIGREQIDAVRFQRQVADGCQEFRQGRFGESAWQLERVLEQWRGMPLAEPARRPFARAQITRLENTYRTAVITKLKADISLGKHREVTGELEALTMAWPEDGEVWRLLVTCLYRSERPMEAARVCRQAIQALRDQGLDDRPMRELQHAALAGALPRHRPLPANLVNSESTRAVPPASGAAVPGHVTGGTAGNRDRSAEIALNRRMARSWFRDTSADVRIRARAPWETRRDTTTRRNTEPQRK